jgi:ABC-2 type transport system ATP-binding protein
MDNIILDIKNLSKSYNNIKALDNFSLSLKKGEIFGLLGPNGAGKTTLISILSGTLKDFSGTVYFKKQDLFSNRKLKNLIGIVPQDMAFYEELSAMDNLIFWAYIKSKRTYKELFRRNETQAKYCNWPDP